ncbi:transcription antitermination factor NusB [Corynebacterium sp. S7]
MSETTTGHVPEEPKNPEDPKGQRNHKRRGTRYRARRRAVDILFEAEARDLDPVAIVEDRVQLAKNPDNQVAPVNEYTRTLVAGTAEKLDDLDDTIERFLSQDWELRRLPAVDRAILRVAAWEIMFNDDVDGPISVVEGVEMASEYSGSQASPYIHAVLDDIVQLHAANAPEVAAAQTEEPETEELEAEADESPVADVAAEDGQS